VKDATPKPRALARQIGETIADVVLDALRHYRGTQGQPSPPGRIKRWRRLLRRDQARLIRPEVPTEALYNQDTGLPE